MEELEFKNAIIDADSILYQIAHVQPSPALCKKALDNSLSEIMSATEATNGMVFIKGANNFRYLVAEDYKGTRKNTIEPEVKDRIDMLYEYSKDFCIESDDAEADDYCGVAAQLSMDENESYVVCHIDKDLDMIPGWHYNFRKKEFYNVSVEEGHYHLMKQLLMGDATDNIQGIKGLGPKTAEKILKDVTHKHMFDKVIDTYKLKIGNDWEKALCKTANLIYIRMSSKDFKELTLKELEERFNAWNKTTGTGTLLPTDQTMPLDLSITSKTLKQEDDTLEESN